VRRLLRLAAVGTGAFVALVAGAGPSAATCVYQSYEPGSGSYQGFEVMLCANENGPGSVKHCVRVTKFGSDCSPE
jgi:hypothetical protein